MTNKPVVSGAQSAGARRKKVQFGWLIWVLAPIAVVGFILSILLSASLDSSSTVYEDVAFDDTDGPEVVYVGYMRDGGGGVFALPHFLLSGRDNRLAAVETASGELIWDVSIDAWGIQTDLVPLAAGGGRVYVASDLGLTIVDSATGDTIASGPDIVGLGDQAQEGVRAYGYDSDGDVIVALAIDGELLQIPVGADEAAPASSSVADRWFRAIGRIDSPHCLPECQEQLDDGVRSPDGQLIETVGDGAFEGVTLTNDAGRRSVVVLGRTGVFG